MAAEWHQERLWQLVFGCRSRQDARARIGLSSTELAHPPAYITEVIQRLQQYAGGATDSFLDLSLDLDDRTAFQRQVIWHCRQISAGETLTYGQLAARAGSPGAARAVGQVMATNRIPLIIPCHRVVSTQGALGGFSAPGGLTTKRRLLNMENRS